MELHSIWATFPEMQKRLSRVTDYFVRVVDETPALIKDDLQQFLLTPGKMLRPAFILMAATSGENISEHIYEVAAAIELLHAATLIHDDVIDFSPARRNKPTLHVNLGIKRAVLAGDYLFARSLELASTAHNDLLVSTMNKGITRLCLSEIDQDSGLGDYFIDRETYFNRIHGKTAELFALSCRVGAVLGGADEALCDAFYDLGWNYGMAFQINDDVLDYRGAAQRMGKPVGNDLKDGIPTLPLIIALEKGDPVLERICRSRFKYRLRGQIKKRVLDGGFDKEAAAVGETHRQNCLNQLSALDFADRELFISIIEKLKFRDF